MADLLTQAEQIRQRITRAERREARRMVQAYQGVSRRLDAEAERIERRLARAIRRGEEVSEDLLRREQRIVRLQEAVERELRRFTERALPIVAGQVQGAREAGGQTAHELVDIFTDRAFDPRLATDAIEQLAAATDERTVLGQLLQDAAREGRERVTQTLVDGVALGRNPRVIAREIRTAGNLPLARSLRISRTETLRAFRESSRLTYAANRDVVEGWVWVCALDSRSCASCIAQHGEVFSVDEPMASHPNCRCTQAPVTPLTDPVRAGSDWFRSQPEHVQRQVLGSGGLREYRGNRLTLPDFVAQRRDPRWGASTRQAGLAEARRNAELRRMREAVV